MSKVQVEKSTISNLNTFLMYKELLTRIALSRFEWKGLPTTIKEHQLEKNLFLFGAVLFFNDENLNSLLQLPFTGGNGINIYDEPIERNVNSVSGYQNTLNDTNSIICYGNYSETAPAFHGELNMINLFARRLSHGCTTADINLHAQKTPVLLKCAQNQLMTLRRLYQKYDGNEPVIFADKNFDINNVGVLSTNAPFIADKIQGVNANIWNEAMLYLGIPNIVVNKKERLISSEVSAAQAGAMASTLSPLTARQKAAEAINEMFNTNISVAYRVAPVPTNNETVSRETAKEGE
ncbi:MAG: hypothetical protein MJ237_08365 [bacterium]|nr:hypothetical protein [bacterium]